MQVFSRGCGEPLRCFYSMNKDLNREKLSIFVLRHKIDHFINRNCTTFRIAGTLFMYFFPCPHFIVKFNFFFNVLCPQHQSFDNCSSGDKLTQKHQKIIIKNEKFAKLLHVLNLVESQSYCLDLLGTEPFFIMLGAEGNYACRLQQLKRCFYLY